MASEAHVLAIDQGTTSTRAILFDMAGEAPFGCEVRREVSREVSGGRVGLGAARGRWYGAGRRPAPGIKPIRAISTGQLRGLLPFHLRPIDVVVYHGSRRDLVLRRVSRLDAFSGYPVRT